MTTILDGMEYILLKGHEEEEGTMYRDTWMEI